MAKKGPGQRNALPGRVSANVFVGDQDVSARAKKIQTNKIPPIWSDGK